MKNALIGFFLATTLYFGTASVYQCWGPAQMKALVRVIVVEFNRGRSWDRSLMAAIAASTSLADLKVKVSALAGRPDITADMVRDEMEEANADITSKLKDDPDLQWLLEN